MPFNYDAYDAVDEWWAEWGVISERAESLSRHSLPLEFKVTTIENIEEVKEPEAD